MFYICVYSDDYAFLLGRLVIQLSLLLHFFFFLKHRPQLGNLRHPTTHSHPFTGEPGLIGLLLHIDYGPSYCKFGVEVISLIICKCNFILFRGCLQDLIYWSRICFFFMSACIMTKRELGLCMCIFLGEIDLASILSIPQMNP